MKKQISRARPEVASSEQKRRGSIVVLSAAVLVMVIAFTAFTVDIGYITLTRAELQRAADASALGSGLELYQGFGVGTALDWGVVDSLGRYAATEMAALHDAGDRESVYADAQRDVRFGQAVWDESTSSWQLAWGVAPYNLVEVTLRRSQGDTTNGSPGGNGDGPLPLFFAPMIGQSTANVTVTAQAALLPGSGFRISPCSPQTAGVLPFSVSEDSWNDLLAGIGDDNYSRDPDTDAVSSGYDGVLELVMFPQDAGGGGNGNGNGNGNAGNGNGNGNNNNGNGLTPGNFGTVDIGNPNNSTADLVRQIQYGLNDDDLAFYNGEFRTDLTPLYLNGDTGISAGMQSALETIIGLPRAISIYSTVSGPGNNATFTIVKFVGITIIDVDLTGNPKTITIQPATFQDETVIPSGGSVSIDSILTPVRLIR